jgi:hypothetical protein
MDPRMSRHGFSAPQKTQVLSSSDVERPQRATFSN